MKRVKRLVIAATVLLALGLGYAYAQQTKFEPYGIAPTISAAYDIGLLGNVWRDIFTNGHVVSAGGTAPTCSAACGTTATVLGNDTAMVWSLTGSSQATPIVITFSRAFAQIPACSGTNQTTVNSVTKILTTTTTATVSFTGTPTASDKVSIICLGAGG
jgi:hypothetical protein